jgi:hypothetical protein
MSEQERREPLSTRVSRAANEVIEHEAEAERTTPSHIARRWLEDAARAHAEQTGRAA